MPDSRTSVRAYLTLLFSISACAASPPAGHRPRTLRTKLQDLGLHVAHSVEADEDDLP
jgi:hypothetical protein